MSENPLPINTMICQRCTRRSSYKLITQRPIMRTIATSPPFTAPSDPPPATSTSAAQPFSTPFTPSPTKTPGIPPGSGSLGQESMVKSSVPVGTLLKGLSYMKGQEAPLAREDSEYPSWLWGLLGTGSKDVKADEEAGDAFGVYPSLICFHPIDFSHWFPETTAKSKKQRRLASKAARALKAGGHEMQQTIRVPLEEQSIDLPAGMGLEETRRAQGAREDLNTAMRRARRKKIKESNFLKSMR